MTNRELADRLEALMRSLRSNDQKHNHLPRPATSLADVIRRALIGDRVGRVHPNQFHYSGVINADEIAAVVAAHLASDAVIERMAAASCYDHEGENAPFTFADDPVSDWWNCRPDHERAHYRAMARADIAAVVGAADNG